MDRSVMDRLVLTRHLFELANQSLKITNDVGLHSCANLMQDAVEAFLIAVADHLNASIAPRTDFDKYFVQIDRAIAPKELPLKTRLLRLNQIRVSSKHHGILPPRGECESLANTARDFFEQVSAEHMGVNFLTATPIDLLTGGETKTLLAQAKLDREAGDLESCILNCRKALYLEVEHDYDVSQFRANAPAERGFLAALGRYSKAPFYAQSDSYVRDNVRDATDFIVFDHATLERSLLTDGVDPTTFWNVLRLTPALWRARDTKQWFVKRDLELIASEALIDNVDYVLSSTVEMVLAMHTRKRAIKFPPHGRFEVEVTLAREGIPVYRKADSKSEVVGTTPPGLTSMEAEFNIDGVEDGERYWNVLARLEDRFLTGYVLQSDLSFEK